MNKFTPTKLIYRDQLIKVQQGKQDEKLAIVNLWKNLKSTDLRNWRDLLPCSIKEEVLSLNYNKAINYAIILLLLLLLLLLLQ